MNHEVTKGTKRALARRAASHCRAGEEGNKKPNHAASFRGRRSIKGHLRALRDFVTKLN